MSLHFDKFYSPPPKDTSTYSHLFYEIKTWCGDAVEPWPADATLYQPFEAEQILLPEHASCLAVRSYLLMCQLPIQICMRPNAEFMSAKGRLSRVPVLRVGCQTVAEFENIVRLVQQKRATIQMNEAGDYTRVGNVKPTLDLDALVTYVENTFSLAEYYMCFVDESVYHEVTVPRYSYFYPWPLSKWQMSKKRQQVFQLMRAYQWNNLTLPDVLQKIEQCLQMLTLELCPDNENLFDRKHTYELDAIIFGHLYAILTLNLPNSALQQLVLKYNSLAMYVWEIEKRYFAKESIF